MLTYTGKKLLTNKTINGEEIKSYLPSPELVEAVNLAILLKRPLLLMGEPGCGKTRLAEAVAYELHGSDMDKYFFRWDIKSTTKAKDGIYQYDALKRLYHAQLKDNTEEAKQAADISNYIEYGELTKAFEKGKNIKNGNPSILLIDEIDKADIDFPNDLLLELEKKTTKIPETNEDITAEEGAVLIFITSNREKELPAAFLRRCLFFFIEFPTEQLPKIIANYIQFVDEKTIKKAIKSFMEIRERLGEREKKPSTSELIDWFEMIDYYTKLKEEKPEAERNEVENRLIAQLDWIGTDKIPFQQVLLKTWQASQQFRSDDD